MIELTRLNGKSLAVNADLIKFVEQAPDTVLTLVTGEKLVVKESARVVMDRIVEFRRSLLIPNSASAVSLDPTNTISKGEV
jgi:flagellar protein FlbD